MQTVFFLSECFPYIDGAPNFYKNNARGKSEIAEMSARINKLEDDMSARMIKLEADTAQIKNLLRVGFKRNRREIRQVQELLDKDWSEYSEESHSHSQSESTEEENELKKKRKLERSLNRRQNKWKKFGRTESESNRSEGTEGSESDNGKDQEQNEEQEEQEVLRQMED